jgi:hypothetical protein
VIIYYSGNEKWDDLVGFEGLYRVSTYGRFWAYPKKSRANTKFVKTRIGKRGINWKRF